jgi:hypothetical protein
VDDVASKYFIFILSIFAPRFSQVSLSIGSHFDIVGKKISCYLARDIPFLSAPNFRQAGSFGLIEGSMESSSDRTNGFGSSLQFGRNAVGALLTEPERPCKNCGRDHRRSNYA